MKEHKETYSEDYSRDFIDRYIKEIKKGENPSFTGTTNITYLPYHKNII